MQGKINPKRLMALALLFLAVLQLYGGRGLTVLYWATVALYWAI